MIMWCVCTCFCAHLISWYARITLHPHTPRSALRQSKKVKVNVKFIVICSKLHGNNSDIKMWKMREKVRQTCFLCRLKAELVQLNWIRCICLPHIRWFLESPLVQWFRLVRSFPWLQSLPGGRCYLWHPAGNVKVQSILCLID